MRLLTSRWQEGPSTSNRQRHWEARNELPAPDSVVNSGMSNLLLLAVQRKQAPLFCMCTGPLEADARVLVRVKQTVTELQRLNEGNRTLVCLLRRT